MTGERPFITATEAEFPIIDVGPYLADAPGALDAVATAIRVAMESLGFMMFRNTGVPQGIVDAAFAATRRFHALPETEKLAIKVDQNQSGYVPQDYTSNEHSPVGDSATVRRDASEVMIVWRERAADDPNVLAGKALCGLNRWPGEAVLPGFRDATIRYLYAVTALAFRMLPVFARALDMPADHFAGFLRDPTVLLRMVRYPAVGEIRSDQFGSNAHTDSSFVTFLPQSDVQGLQVQTPPGEWVDQPVLPGAFVVNSGNMLKRQSNDRFKATPHRVPTAVERDRYSIAAIFRPDLEDVVAPVASCVGPDNPPLYEPVVSGDRFLRHLAGSYRHLRHRAAA
ncbi:MAG: isopenicillin N synthase family oxygenase [Alphaproteobacteria bacterium]|nr:isopenicillin N synthase family oxygenase [Alphaproteobacteria bacterium]